MQKLAQNRRTRFRSSDGAEVDRADEKPVTRRELIFAIENSGMSAEFIRKLREKGGTVESFETLRRHRVLASDALTWIQDQLEGLRDSGLKRDRIAAVMTVRHRLELELWP